MGTLPERRDAKGELIPRDTVIYDVKMRGYDRSFWKTLTGDPSIIANKLRLNAEEAASYYQFLFGIFEFAVNVPAAPTAGDARKIGLINPSAQFLMTMMEPCKELFLLGREMEQSRFSRLNGKEIILYSLWPEQLSLIIKQELVKSLMLFI